MRRCKVYSLGTLPSGPEFLHSTWTRVLQSRKRRNNRSSKAGTYPYWENISIYQLATYYTSTMPVPGFSVEQDAQVQAYRFMRTQHIGQLKQQRMQDRLSRGLPAHESTADKVRRVCGLRERKLAGTGTRTVSAKQPEAEFGHDFSDEVTLCGENESLDSKEVLGYEKVEDDRRTSWIRKQETKVLVTSWIL